LRIKAVILDFGGTIADGALEWEPYYEELRSYLAGRGHDVEMADLQRAVKGALDGLERVRLRGKELAFEEVYANVLLKLGVPLGDEDLKAIHGIFKRHYISSFYSCTERVLDELSGKYKVALLSNTMSDQPRVSLAEKRLDRHFALIICSRDLGVRKPNPRIFRHVLRELGVEPDEAVHVGDNIEADMDGAEGVGITPIWIRNSNSPPWHGYAVDSICDLPELLRKIENSEV
jgi:putative hydrolase of the HAD superfamily